MSKLRNLPSEPGSSQRRCSTILHHPIFAVLMFRYERHHQLSILVVKHLEVVIAVENLPGLNLGQCKMRLHCIA